MTEKNIQQDMIPESSAAKIAYYKAFISRTGFLFYMAFACLGTIKKNND